MKKICTLQKRAVRLIDNSKSMSHSDPIFLKYNILKINDMVDFNQAMFMFKYTNGLLPDSFENMFNKLGNFDRSLSYQVDLLNFSSLQTFPSYTLLKIWNNLPLELKRSTSINLFKNKIKKALFEKYLLKCNRPNCFSCKQ